MATAATATSSSRSTPYPAAQTYDFHGKFSEAQTLLVSGNKAQAKILFEEILSHIKSIHIQEDSIFPAACKLGLASACGDAISARASYAFMAKDDLYRLFDNRFLFDRQMPNDRKGSYEGLIRCFKQLAELIPSLQEEIAEKVRECLKHVPSPQMAAAASTISGPSASTGPDSPRISPRRVSRRKPDDNLCCLFAAVVFIAIAVTVAVALYRRNIVKIN